MNIASYHDLISAAEAQTEPQRLLFVFAKAELPNGYTEQQKQAFEQGAGGALEPVLCVDKLPADVINFQTLLDESRQTGLVWDIAFVSALGGRGGFPPNNDEAVQPLQMMVQKIQGGMIADFLTFDKHGELVSLL